MTNYRLFILFIDSKTRKTKYTPASYRHKRRLEAMDGKGLIVCMSRRICVDLYNEIVKLRPQWHDEDDAKGSLKVVMTGSAADGPDWQQHIRTKPRREALAKRLKDPKDPLKLV